MTKTEGEKPIKTEALTEPTTIICGFCKTDPCECKFLICPFHGKVNAKKDRDGKFNCTKENCEIIREEKDLE